MSVRASGDGSAAPGMSPRESARQLEGEIAVLRDELTGLVAELDRRRHGLTDFECRPAATSSGSRRRWESPRKRCRLCLAERLAEPSPESGDGPDRTPPGSGLAHGRRPDRVAAEPGIPARILTAAANAAVASAIKRVLKHSLQRVMTKGRVEIGDQRAHGARPRSAAER